MDHITGNDRQTKVLLRGATALQKLAEEQETYELDFGSFIEDSDLSGPLMAQDLIPANHYWKSAMVRVLLQDQQPIAWMFYWNRRSVCLSEVFFLVERDGVNDVIKLELL